MTSLAFAALSCVAFAGARADAQSGGAQRVPTSDAIAPELGEIRWGWSEEQLVAHFEEKIRTRYRRPLRTARDALQEDELRQRMAAELARVRENRYAFNGRA
ncbi:MAG: hypothetical protein AAF447_24620, partial [Myxococcota bacterium]